MSAGDPHLVTKRLFYITLASAVVFTGVVVVFIL